MKSSMVYDVSFPNLGLNFTVNPVALRLGIIEVHWYGIILAIAFLAGYMYVSENFARFKIDNNSITDAVVTSTICGIVGARLYYVLFYPGDFYRINPLKIFCISEGGLAIYGAIIGGVLGAAALCKLKGAPILPLLDLCAIALPLSQAIGRWGNFVNQEAFGEKTTLPWAMASQNTFGEPVHPCFLYESLWCLGIFFLLHFLSHSDFARKRRGNVALLYTLFYSVGRFFIEQLRTDSLMLGNFRVSQLLSGGLVIIALTFLIGPALKQKYTSCQGLSEK